ncbi:MAG: dihydroorotate dehydrogenase-like protein [Prolixibacteraceae bacterium]|nr:dihydroorotate dehydrogenase-like protein [Prolixibacteraceae bacterium]MBN2775575.1 dihydroorotate dehydrogenase-like protein [Prolixibacteraceae bacterium]
MADLSTRFFGLELKSPVIAASCGLTNSVENIKKMADNGVGAVVLKSIFEEEILHELNQELAMREPQAGADDEYLDYFDYIIKKENLNKYISLIEKTKKAVDVPIIASINCISSAEWISFANKLEKSGADAIELNLFIMPSDPSKSGSSNELFYFETIERVKKQVSIPVTIKISSYFSNLAKMLVDLSKSGVDGITVFNRFYMPDIDIEKEITANSAILSNNTDYLLPLRWIALMNNKIECPLAATTGIHTSKTMIKFLLAGANAVQVSSILYKEGIETIKRFNDDLAAWMNKKGYASIKDFKGKITVSSDQPAQAFERVQFMKHYGEY